MITTVSQQLPSVINIVLLTTRAAPLLIWFASAEYRQQRTRACHTLPCCAPCLAAGLMNVVGCLMHLRSHRAQLRNSGDCPPISGKPANMQSLVDCAGPLFPLGRTLFLHGHVYVALCAYADVGQQELKHNGCTPPSCIAADVQDHPCKAQKRYATTADCTSIWHMNTCACAGLSTPAQMCNRADYSCRGC